MQPLENMALNNHVIRRDRVGNEDLCQLNCYLEPNCVSYNYGPSGDGDFVCELSNRDHQGVSSSDLRTRDGFTYTTITVSKVNEWTVPPNYFPRITGRMLARLFYSTAKRQAKCEHPCQGRRRGESARLPQMWPDMEFLARDLNYVELMVGSGPCSGGFLRALRFS